MVYADVHKHRQKLWFQLGGLAILVGTVLAFMVAAERGSNKDSNADVEKLADAVLPIGEVSGVALREEGGSPVIYAVGDSGASLAKLSLDQNGFSEALTFDFGPALLKEFSLCLDAEHQPCPDQSYLLRQWEGIAVDGAGQVVLLKEYPASIFVLNAELTTLQSLVKLDFSATAAIGAKRSPAGHNSFGEGLILLKDGHVAVAKEKSPTVMIEFGPRGSKPLGISKDTVLPADQPWAISEKRQEYIPLKIWTTGQGKCDVSELAASPQGDIYLLSQKCRKVTQYGSWKVDEDTAPVIKEWRLPKKRPEGLAVMSNGDFIVGRDSGKEHKKDLFWYRPK